jgi:hypothetical protein
MSENQQSNHDPLEEAIRAFQGMTVCERPPDAEVLARFGVCQGDLSQPACSPIPSKRRHLMYLIGSATAAAVLLFGALALFLRNSPPQESVQLATTSSPARPGDVAVRPPSKSAKSEKLAVPPLKERVAESQVIVVATGVDSAPAPPDVPGDSPEVLIRWQVKRFLKGDLDKKEIKTRTSVAAAEFIGKDWIVFLSPDFVAGKHQLAACLHIDFERTVKELIANEKK